MSTKGWVNRGLVAASLLAAASLGAPAVAAGRSPLSTRLEAVQSRVGPREDVTLRYTLHNGSAKDVFIVYWQTPVRGVLNDLFQVLRDGKPVDYIGREYKWAAPQPADFVKVPAGGELTATVELSSVYDMSVSGSYSIGFRLHTLEEPVLLGRALDAATRRGEDLRSNTVVIDVERDGEEQAARALPPDFDDAGAAIEPNAVTPGYVSCSSTRQSTLRSALGAAETMSSKAKAYLASGVHDSGYTTWFGSYTAANYSTAKSHFNAIYGVFNTKKVTFYCDCTDSAYAYVYPSQPYNIHLCNAFWSAPLTGIDSKGGTLVHECSHFTVVAGTDDWAYGTAGCQALSTKKKLDNADCHEYFAETK